MSLQFLSQPLRANRSSIYIGSLAIPTTPRHVTPLLHLLTRPFKVPEHVHSFLDIVCESVHPARLARPVCEVLARQGLCSTIDEDAGVVLWTLARAAGELLDGYVTEEGQDVAGLL